MLCSWYYHMILPFRTKCLYIIYMGNSSEIDIVTKNLLYGPAHSQFLLWAAPNRIMGMPTANAGPARHTVGMPTGTHGRAQLSSGHPHR
jgi:hypothetical protein